MRAALVAVILLLPGCSTGPRTYAIGSSEARDDYECRQALKHPDLPRYKAFNGTTFKTYEECGADKIYIGELLASAVPAQPQRSITIGGGDYSAPVPNYDAQAPLPNILPQTTRCQSVPSGMGTYQTT